MKSLPYKKLSEISSRTFSVTLRDHGFHEVGKSCLFVRRLSDVVHVVYVAKSRNGPKCKVRLGLWVQEFSLDKDIPLVERLSSSWSRDEQLGVYSIESGHLWPIDTSEVAEESFAAMSSPFVRGAIPWFQKYLSRASVGNVLMGDAPEQIRIALSSESPHPMPDEIGQIPIWDGKEPDPAIYLKPVARRVQ